MGEDAKWGPLSSSSSFELVNLQYCGWKRKPTIEYGRISYSEIGYSKSSRKLLNQISHKIYPGLFDESILWHFHHPPCHSLSEQYQISRAEISFVLVLLTVCLPKPSTIKLIVSFDEEAIWMHFITIIILFKIHLISISVMAKGFCWTGSFLPRDRNSPRARFFLIIVIEFH